MHPPPPTDPLASPCVRNCCLDEGNVCMGCGRSLEEIIAWSTASAAEKSRRSSAAAPASPPASATDRREDLSRRREGAKPDKKYNYWKTQKFRLPIRLFLIRLRAFAP